MIATSPSLQAEKVKRERNRQKGKVHQIKSEQTPLGAKKEQWVKKKIPQSLLLLSQSDDPNDRGI